LIVLRMNLTPYFLKSYFGHWKTFVGMGKATACPVVQS